MEVGSIGVAFPQALPPGYHTYQLEVAANRKPCGIAVAGVFDEDKGWEFCATTGADTVSSRLVTENKITKVTTIMNDCQLGTWRGKKYGDEGRWESEAGQGSIEVAEYEARWRSPSGDTVQFRLRTPQSLGNVVIGVSRALRSLVSSYEQPSEDIVWADGRTSIDVFAVVLTLRMCVFTYDFTPSSK